MNVSLNEEYLTVAEAATLFKVSQSTVWRWINQGAVPAYRVGRRGIRLLRGDLVRFVAPARQERGQVEEMAKPELAPLGPLSDAEQKAGLAALAKLRGLRQEMLRQRKGALFPNAADELHKLRTERTRQLQ